jgi:hypothetical protein
MDNEDTLPLTIKSRVFGVSAMAAKKTEHQSKVIRWSG